ncbi:MAG: pyridoxamine 5'-phosphate oxidase [Bacteroidetes bacterium]|nr:MAG: pyridoxamine 5'-phosphate oxidase [Bacteroidota bacterium]
MKIQDIRTDYKLASLEIENVQPNPIEQFKIWFEEAIKDQVLEPNAMVLSTVDANLQPHARVVLVKDISESGFTFFTNYQSNKGQELSQNSAACLTFFYPQMERQIRIEGSVSKISREESDLYFQSRPLGSKIGAWVSEQSKKINSRAELEQKQAELEKQYSEKPIPIPEYWGGYLLKPNMVEFWQGRSSRLHDRILYELDSSKNWQISRLSP